MWIATIAIYTINEYEVHSGLHLSLLFLLLYAKRGSRLVLPFYITNEICSYLYVLYGVFTCMVQKEVNIIIYVRACVCASVCVYAPYHMYILQWWRKACLNIYIYRSISSNGDDSSGTSFLMWFINLLTLSHMRPHYSMWRIYLVLMPHWNDTTFCENKNENKKGKNEQKKINKESI